MQDLLIQQDQDLKETGQSWETFETSVGKTSQRKQRSENVDLNWDLYYEMSP